jgi:hypothetical protein
MQTDYCGEYSGVERRKHCEMVVTLNQRFNDFMEATKDYRARQEAATKDISECISVLSDQVKEMRRPYKILVWALTIMTGAFLLDIAHWAIEFFRSKISWH